MMITSAHKWHEAGRAAAELTRQSAIGSAKLAFDSGGSHATYAAAIRPRKLLSIGPSSLPV
jgi:hypothetical protein